MDIYDILLDSTLDVAIRDGDLATGEATKQSQVLLLLTAKGEWKQHPQRAWTRRPGWRGQRPRNWHARCAASSRPTGCGWTA